jgi:cytochrome c553
MTAQTSLMLSIFSAISFLALSVVAENNEDHPVVPGFERFAEVDTISNVERGNLLINELNCASCHEAESSWSVKPKQAPILTGVGGRILPEYFESYLLNPQHVKPGTTMPNVLAGKSEVDKKTIAESLAHFLASTGTVAKQNSNSKSVSQGEQLFHSVGCVACHNPQNEDVKIATSIPLGSLENKYTLSSLAEYIKNPLHTRPSGRMPQFNLTDTEAQNVAAYLIRDAVVESKINFAYYEGKWEKLPDFKQLNPVSKGITSGFDVQLGKAKDHFGIVFTGFWETQADGKYRFKLTSDDGSRLIIDGETVVDNDGIHGMTSVEKEALITAGVHEIRVEFFENQGGEDLRVIVNGNGLKEIGLESLLRPARKIAIDPDNKPFVLDLKKAAVGRGHFQTVGCASCHEMKLPKGQSGEAQALTSTLPSPTSFSKMNPLAGCLSAAQSAVEFDLNPFQRKCLAEAINAARTSTVQKTKPEQLIHEKLVTLNCYACHNRQMNDRSIRGGVVDMRGDSLEIYNRKKWFTGTQIEMGDEGQHPPALKSIGAKLNRKWLDHVLLNSANDRPYMLTRMPKFGADNLGTLADELVAFDQLKNVPAVTQSEPVRKIKSHGRFFAGDQALSCIKCHTFGKYPATGVQAIDLTTMTKRLNRDWFQMYMLKPSEFRRGTRMPESWPGGKSYYPDILKGDTHQQIDSIWAFLDDGERAAKPKGLVRSKMELKPGDTPKVYRNFIAGAGARAIGVGYPEEVNIAFDAELCRLALLWQENFIDASRHWTGRGQGFEAPLGENLLELPEAIVFSKNAVPDQWTKTKGPGSPQFKGYRFDAKRRPIFVYQLDDVEIEDQPIPFLDDGQPLIIRKFTFNTQQPCKLYYLVGQSMQAKIKGDAITFGDRWGTLFSGEGKIQLSKDKNGNVIAELNLLKGQTVFQQEYQW